MDDELRKRIGAAQTLGDSAKQHIDRAIAALKARRFAIARAAFHQAINELSAAYDAIKHFDNAD